MRSQKRPRRVRTWCRQRKRVEIPQRDAGSIGKNGHHRHGRHRRQDPCHDGVDDREPGRGHPLEEFVGRDDQHRPAGALQA